MSGVVLHMESQDPQIGGENAWKTNGCRVCIWTGLFGNYRDCEPAGTFWRGVSQTGSDASLVPFHPVFSADPAAGTTDSVPRLLPRLMLHPASGKAEVGLCPADGDGVGQSVFRKLTEDSQVIFSSLTPDHRSISQWQRCKRWANTATVQNNVLTLYIMQIVSPLIDTC